MESQPHSAECGWESTTASRVRLAISQWSEDAPRGAVSTFCIEHDISRKSIITVSDLEGEILIEHIRPAPGINYVGNGRPQGGRPNTSEPSPES